jgi:hypothetical protein
LELSFTVRARVVNIAPGGIYVCLRLLEKCRAQNPTAEPKRSRMLSSGQNQTLIVFIRIILSFRRHREEAGQESGQPVFFRLTAFVFKFGSRKSICGMQISMGRCSKLGGKAFPQWTSRVLPPWRICHRAITLAFKMKDGGESLTRRSACSAGLGATARHPSPFFALLQAAA